MTNITTTTDTPNGSYLKGLSTTGLGIGPPTAVTTSDIVDKSQGVSIPAGSTVSVLQIDVASPNYAAFEITFTPPGAADPVYATVSSSSGDLSAAAINGRAEVVGTHYFATTNQGGDAFLWTPTSGLTLLGTLDGTASNLAGSSSSSATALNADGGVVVGYSGVTVVGNLTQHGFRWTQALGLQDLGALAGPAGRSEATAVSDDGTVVVGASDTNIVDPGLTPNRDAFRWTLTNAATGAGTLIDLGQLANGGGSSAAAISGDGGTIVGYGVLASGARHAVLWNATTSGPQDLGTVAGLDNSRALAVSANGAVVVGTSYQTINPLAQRTSYSAPDFVFNATNGYPLDSSSVAFRYTQATGMQDLNGLLTKAGVDLGGAQLLAATSITPDGQFIGGVYVPAGSPQNTPTQSFVARYIDSAVVVTTTPPTTTPPPTTPTTPTPPIAGLTTLASVQASVDDLGHDRAKLLIQSRGYLSPITDDAEPLAAPGQIHAVLQGDDLAYGFRGRYSSPSGLAILGGASWGRETVGGVPARDGANGTLAIRYIPTRWRVWRPFAEVGGDVGHIRDARFTRTYVNGDGASTGSGEAGVDTWAAHGRVGWIWQPNAADQLGAYAEYGVQRGSYDGYVEPLTAANPFEAHVAGGKVRLEVGEIGLRYSHDRAHGLTYGVSVTAAQSFNLRNDLAVSVPGFGSLAPRSTSEPTWVEYTARVGYAFAGRATLSVFAAGVGGSRVGSRTQPGLDLRIVF